MQVTTVEIQLVFEESLVWSMILQPILHTSTEEACEGRLNCCSVIDGKLQLKHESATKKVRIKMLRDVGIADQQKA